MTGFIVITVLIAAAILAYKVWAGTEAPPVELPPTETELLQARLDIHRVSRGVDASLAGSEAHQEAERTKQAIADALDDRR
jgi:hypothetical protein